MKGLFLPMPFRGIMTRDWVNYNEALVRRGEILLGFDFKEFLENREVNGLGVNGRLEEAI
jgi:hypothetical protein